MLISNLADYGDTPFLHKSVSPCGRLITVKYSKKAFFKQAWNEHALLLQARGHTFWADTEEIATRPFDKVFNYLENNAGRELKPDDEVLAVRKVNGFLSGITITAQGAIIQTSGTACFIEDAATHPNDYIRMAAEHVKTDLADEPYYDTKTTLLFEVCHPKDPHIIPETAGSYLIGARNVEDGTEWQQDVLDFIASVLYLEKPVHFKISRDDLLEKVKTDRHEGYVVRAVQDEAPLFKIKTPYYLIQKFLARAGQAKLLRIAFDENYDEEIAAVLKKIDDFGYLTNFYDTDEQTRLEMLREVME